MRKIIIFSIFLTNFLIFSEEIIEFKYKKGTKFRIETEDTQQVYINGNYSSTNRINIQISSEVKSVKDNWAYIQSYFRVLKRESEIDPFLISEEIKSNFSINKQGEYKISSNENRPSVRGIPKFPLKALKTKDTWILPAEEYVEASKISKDIKDFIVKFNVNYTYEGKQKIKNKEYEIITSKYISNYNIKNIKFDQKINQTIYFDLKLGNTYKYNDTYEFNIQNKNNNIKITGNSSGRIVSIDLPKDIQIENKIKEFISKNKIESLDIEKNEKGIILSLDIEFSPDSFQILEKEYEKLSQIAKILSKFKDNNILIEGHTTRFGTEKEMKELSEKRAYSIGNYFIKINAKKENQIFYKGCGSLKPKYPENSPFRSKNRRVEITILNN